MLTLPVDLDLDLAVADPYGDTVSPEPRSLSLVPPLPVRSAPADPDEDPAPRSAPELVPWEDEIPEQAGTAPADLPWGGTESTAWDAHPVPSDLDPAAPPVWTAEAVPGASVAGDGLAVYPLDAPRHARPGSGSDADIPVGQAAPGIPARYDAGPLDDPGAAVISRQVEAARRHLQAALVVANQPAGTPGLGTLLTAVERVLTAVTDLARETRGVLEPQLAERTFPGEARFLCTVPWDTAAAAGPDPYADEVASPGGPGQTAARARLRGPLGHLGQRRGRRPGPGRAVRGARGAGRARRRRPAAVERRAGVGRPGRRQPHLGGDPRPGRAGGGGAGPPGGRAAPPLRRPAGLGSSRPGPAHQPNVIMSSTTDTTTVSTARKAYRSASASSSAVTSSSAIRHFGSSIRTG